MLGIHVILGSAIEIQGKATSFANPTFHFDTSSHLGKHLLYERQPQPRAFVVSGKRVLALSELLKNLVVVFFGNAHAIIRDRQDDLIIPLIDTNHDMPTPVSKLERISH